MQVAIGFSSVMVVLFCVIMLFLCFERPINAVYISIIEDWMNASNAWKAKGLTDKENNNNNEENPDDILCLFHNFAF